MFKFPTALKTDERGLANDVEQLREMVHTLSNVAYNLYDNPLLMMIGIPDEINKYVLQAHEATCTCDKPTEGYGVDETWSLPIPTQALN